MATRREYIKQIHDLVKVEMETRGSSSTLNYMLMEMPASKLKLRAELCIRKTLPYLKEKS